MVEVRARVQAHPSRAHLLPDLLNRLEPLPVEVFTHESHPPSPWAGYKLCLADIPDCSHLLVVQDDTVPCENFAQAAQAVAAAQPDHPVCLYLSRLPRDASSRAEKAMKMNRRYIQLSWRSFLPIVAVLWPRAKAAEFAEWADQHPQLPGQREPRSDDAMAGMWKMRERQTVLATVPSLVEHPDREPSIIGKRAAWGKDKGRCALLLAEDGLAFDWSQP